MCGNDGRWQFTVLSVIPTICRFTAYFADLSVYLIACSIHVLIVAQPVAALFMRHLNRRLTSYYISKINHVILYFKIPCAVCPDFLYSVFGYTLNSTRSGIILVCYFLIRITLDLHAQYIAMLLIAYHIQ